MVLVEPIPPRRRVGLRMQFEAERWRGGNEYLGDTHKPEAILLSLTPLVFERFLPS